MDDLYRDYILEHSRRPHNFGVIEDPSASFEGSNPLCGDRITLQIGVTDGVVARVGFTGRGCAISQASASLLTDEIKGKPLAEVEAFRADDLLDLLGIEISPARLKCAMLSHDTLRHALDELEPAADARMGIASGLSSADAPMGIASGPSSADAPTGIASGTATAGTAGATSPASPAEARP